MPPPQADRARGLVAQVVSHALRLDADAIERGIERMRRRYPSDTDARLARRCIRDASLCAGAASLVLALPSHPALAIPAAITEVVLLARLELVTAARITAIHAPGALADVRDPILALEPLFGSDGARDVVTALHLTAGRRACLAAAARVGLDPSRAIRAVLKHAGLSAFEHLLVTRAFPVAGAVAGAVAAARRVGREGERAAAYFGSATPVPLRTRRGQAPLRCVHADAPSGASTGLRGSAVEAVAILIRTGDRLAAALRGPRERAASLLVEARMRARRGAMVTAGPSPSVA